MGYNVTTEATAILATGMDLAALNAKLGYAFGAVTEESGRYYANSRSIQSKVYNLFYALPAAASAPVAQTVTASLATGRQVDSIMTLLARRERGGEGGGFFSGPTTRQGVATLTRREASTYIDSLTGRY